MRTPSLRPFRLVWVAVGCALPIAACAKPDSTRGGAAERAGSPPDTAARTDAAPARASSARAPAASTPPITASYIAHRTGGGDAPAEGPVGYLRMRKDSVVYCDQGGRKQLSSDGIARALGAEPCDAGSDESDWPCATGPAPVVGDIWRPNQGPDDFMLVGGRSWKVQGHFVTCIADSSMLVVGSSARTFVVTLPGNELVPLSDDGAAHVAMNATWIAWSDYFSNEVHVRRRDEVTSHVLSFSSEGAPPAPVPLAPDDATFVETHKGWGWSDRCWKHMQALDVAWAWAACAAGLALPDADTKARAALLFNEGMIATTENEWPTAQKLFKESLRLRPPKDPGRRQVQDALEDVEGSAVAPASTATGSRP